MPRSTKLASFVSVGLLIVAARGRADEPKPKPENTITIKLAEPVPAQKFQPAPKFWITDITDRSGNAQPMLVLKDRGGVFLDRQPTAILREALEDSLKAANLLAADAASADVTMRLYLFHFGLAEGSGFDFFSKVEFSAVMRNPKTGESQEVKAVGTSIGKGAFRKKNVQKNVEENLQEALKDGIRNFLRGVQLKEALNTLWKAPEAAVAPTGAAEKKNLTGPNSAKSQPNQ
jgi:hypothetical protein